MIVGKIALKNPVLLASGTCGYGQELIPHLKLSALGGLVAKSVTLHPREGNAMPRVVECASGMLNAIGLANVGVESFIRDKLPVLRTLGCAVLANVAGSKAEEYVEIIQRLSEVEGLAGLELNVSCPNVHAGGIEFGRDPRVLEPLVAACRKATRLPLWVKLSPNVTDIVPLAKAAEAGGADALTLINTLVGMRIDIRKKRPCLANVRGGLSGPAIMPVALHLVYQAKGAVSIPIVGMGGIASADDALEFILAGASAIQIGTATFRNPAAAGQVVQGLQAYAKQHRLASLETIIGAGRV